MPAARASPTTDQRGVGRFGGVDIGAFESQGFQFAVVPGSTPQTANIGTAFANPLAVTATANNPVEPVDGGVVTFVASPAANGATAIFLDPSAVIAGGQAALTAAPNNVLGSYTVATSPGGSLSFDLTNTGQVFAALVVNDASDALAPGAGLLSLREAVAFANTDLVGRLEHQLRRDGLRRAAGDHPDRHAARAEQHRRGRSRSQARRSGVTVERRRAEPGVPGRSECHRVDLRADDHRRLNHPGMAAACTTWARSH